MHGEEGVLRSCIWATRPVVVFSHSVMPIRGLFVHKFSWVHLTLGFNKLSAALMFFRPCPPQKKDEKLGRAVRKYLKLKAQTLYIQLSKKCGFQWGHCSHDLFHCETAVEKGLSKFLHGLTFLRSLSLSSCGIGKTFSLLCFPKNLEKVLCWVKKTQQTLKKKEKPKPKKKKRKHSSAPFWFLTIKSKVYSPPFSVWLHRIWMLQSACSLCCPYELQ